MSIISYKIKYIIRKYFQKQNYYRKRNEYKRLLDTMSLKKRIILLGTPEYGNLGDHAIAISELSFLKKNFLDSEIIEITQENLKWDFNGIIKHISDSDILIYTGGGFMGSMYLTSGGGILRNMLKRLPYNRWFIMPSTIYYEDTKSGELEKIIDLQVWNSCKDLTICVRDYNSWRYIESIDQKKFDAFYISDMVFSLDFSERLQSRSGIKLILRNDKEKSNNLNIEKLKMQIENMGYICDEISTRVPYDVLPEDRSKEVSRKLEEISSAKLIITDRLHGLIFSIITNTPCIAIDNKSKKLSGVLEGINQPKYVRLVSQEDIIKTLEEMNNISYFDNDYLYFFDDDSLDKLKKLLEEKILYETFC